MGKDMKWLELGFRVGLVILVLAVLLVIIALGKAG